MLNEIVSPFQSAFVPGQWTAKNSILAHELVCTIKKKKSEKEVLLDFKLDINKAYDLLEWPFISLVLKAFGFDDHFCRLVMFCVKSVLFSILLNGSPTPAFKPHRGIRQGDPLSPYLFILCSKILSRLILQAESSGDIHGIKIAHGAPPVSHLMFTDDTFLFCRATGQEWDVLVRNSGDAPYTF